MKRLLAVVLAMVIVAALTACGSSKKDSDADAKDATQAQTSAEATEAAERESYVIEAGGLKLKYPAEWKDKVTVKASDDKAEFSVEKTKLFDILFNSEEGDVLGTVKGDTYTVISLVNYTVKDDNNELKAMQHDINFILQNLEKDYDFASGEALSEDDDATFEIKTSLVTLHYPKKWQDKVSVDVKDDVVSFSDGDTKLFDLILKKSKEGYMLGTYNDTPIYIVDYPVKSDDDIAMQAAINVIIAHLQEDSNFKIA